MRPHKPQRHFLDRDSFLLGLVVALVTPVMAYGILLTIYDVLEEYFLASSIGFAPDFRTRTLALIAICINLIPFHLYRRWHADNTMRGMVLPTMAYIVTWFWIYGRHLLGL